MVDDERTGQEFLARILDAHTHGYAHGKPLAVALRELHNAKKTKDWIWYVFPQVKDLGRSPISQRFWVRTCEEMSILLGEPAVLAAFTKAFGLAAAAITSGRAVHLGDIFGHDERKVVSSAMLFAGYLDRHPIAGAAELRSAAQTLVGVAVRDGLGCGTTEKFLADC